MKRYIDELRDQYYVEPQKEVTKRELLLRKQNLALKHYRKNYLFK